MDDRRLWLFISYPQFPSTLTRQSAFGLYFEYDEFNQLVRVRQGDQNGPILEEYLYDENGERLMKSEPQINQTTYYIDKTWIQVVNSSGTFDYTYYCYDDTLVGRKDPDGRKYFYHPDHLGSTTLVTNEAGNVVEEITYEVPAALSDTLKNLSIRYNIGLTNF